MFFLFLLLHLFMKSVWRELSYFQAETYVYSRTTPFQFYVFLWGSQKEQLKQGRLKKKLRGSRAENTFKSGKLQKNFFRIYSVGLLPKLQLLNV